MIYLIVGVVAVLAGGAILAWRRRRLALLEAEVDAFLGTDACLCCGFDNLDPLTDDDFAVDEELLMHLLSDLEDPELHQDDAQAARAVPRDFDSLRKKPGQR